MTLAARRVHYGRRWGSSLRRPCDGSTLQTLIDNATAGDTINVTGCIFSDPATVTKSLTIVGGTLTVGAGTTALRIAASGVTVDGMTIRGVQFSNYVEAERGIHVSTAIGDVKIRNCTIDRFGNTGVWTDRVSTGLSVASSTITRMCYTGIMVCSSSSAMIEYNTISDIGMSYFTGGDRTGINNNAYGLSFTFANSPTIMSNACTARYNRVALIPAWHGLDTHGGIGINYSYNTTADVRRALVFTSGTTQRPTNCLMTNNRIEANSYTYDPVAVFIYDSLDSSVTDNAISSSYADQGQFSGAGNTRVRDYTSLSTNLTVSGNTLI